MPSFLGRFFIACTIAAPILVFAAMTAASGGHGSYLPAKILFPYTMASTALTGEITIPFVALGFLQYPVYGAVLDAARSAGRFTQTLGVIVGLHLVFVALAFAISSPSFTP